VLTSAAGAALQAPAVNTSRCRVCVEQHATSTADSGDPHAAGDSTPVASSSRGCNIDIPGLTTSMLWNCVELLACYHAATTALASFSFAALQAARVKCSCCRFCFPHCAPRNPCIWTYQRETLLAKLLCRSSRMVCYARTLSLRGTPKTRMKDIVCGDIIVLERSGYALSPTGRAWIEITARVH
jgi:hypothetical protein